MSNLIESEKGIFIIIALAFATFIVLTNLIHVFEEQAPKETTYVTLVFIDKDKVRGVLGIGGINPTIVMRCSDAHQMQFRIVNNDDINHKLIIENIIESKLLEPAELDTLMLSGEEQGKYRIYDPLYNATLGEFLIVKVTAIDDC